MWLPFSLGNAFFESVSNALAKRGAQQIDTLSTAWASRFFSLFIIVPFALFKGFYLPDNPTFWMIVVAIGFLHTATSIPFVKAIKDSPLSLTLPIVAFTPVFLLITSPILVGEYPSTLGILGVLLVVLGSYFLNLSKKAGGFSEPLKAIFKEKGTRLMMLVAFLFSITSNLDKMAIKVSNPYIYSFFSISCIVIFLTIILFGKNISIRNILKKRDILMPVGISAGLSYAFYIVAVSMTQVPYAISVKRTSTIFGSLWGYLFFKEEKIAERLVGTIVMVVGVILIALS